MNMRTIERGEALPDVEVETCGEDLGRRSIKAVLGEGKVILLGMPGAFTPTCNDLHLPAYFRSAETFKELGVDNICVVTTNDRWTNAKWEEDLARCVGVDSPIQSEDACF